MSVDSSFLPNLADAEVSSAERAQRCHRALCDEFNPVGTTENLVVWDLANRAAHMAALECNVAQLEQEVAAALASVLHPLEDSGQAGTVAAVASATASGHAGELQRQLLGHSRGLYRALQTLRVIQAERRGHEQADELNRTDPRFATETDCRSWMVARLRRGEQPCSRCGQTGHGNYLAARRAWECSHCRRQSGIRTGTVMNASALPLVTWFAAIRLLIVSPSLKANALATRIGLQRIATVRSMQRKIHSAMASENASQLLVGLDETYG